MKDLIITLSLRTARKYENENTVVVFPASREMLDLLKLFLRLNKRIKILINRTAWNGGELEDYKKYRDAIRQRINDLFQTVLEFEKHEKGGKQ